MSFKVIEETAPAIWASYLINGDSSGIEDTDIKQADKFQAWTGGRIVSCKDDEEPWFGTYEGMRHMLITYIIHVRDDLTEEEQNDIDKLRSESPFEVFYSDISEQTSDTRFWNADDRPIGTGYFYWFCFPGCMPDSEPFGPFESEASAYRDAIENHLADE